MSKLTRSKPKIFQPMESSNLSCVEPGVRCKQALIAADDGVLPVTDELAEYIEKDEIEYDDWDGDWGEEEWPAEYDEGVDADHVQALVGKR